LELEAVAVPGCEHGNPPTPKSGLQGAVGGEHHRALPSRDLDHRVVPLPLRDDANEALRERASAYGARRRPFDQTVQLSERRIGDEQPRSREDAVDLGFEGKTRAQGQEECVRVEEDRRGARSIPSPTASGGRCRGFLGRTRYPHGVREGRIAATSDSRSS
jgi:hypothetical protein